MNVEQQFRIAVCDDDAADLQLTLQMTHGILQQQNVKHQIFCFDSAAALLSAIERGEAFDILLLDVLMEPLNGMELAAAIRRLGSETAIVFISCSREMALQGYEVSAVRYLAKPLADEKLREALMYCIRSRQDKKEILLSTRTGTYRISYADIQCVEAYDRGTRFFLKDEILETAQKFSEVEALLPRSLFVLCHRSYLVNLASVRRIRPYEFELMSGALIPISKHRYTGINKLFICYVAD